MRPSNIILSQIIKGELTFDNLREYNEELLADTKIRIENLYPEEINSGELSGITYQAMLILHDLKSLDVETQIKSILVLSRLHIASERQLYVAAGYSSIEDWLDSYGLNARSGTLSQLLAVAREIVPWCVAHQITVGGNPVTIDWFRRVVGGKCLASRACLMVSFFRKTITQGDIVQQKKTIQLALAAVESPVFTRGYLNDTFSGYTNPQPIIGRIEELKGQQVLIVILEDNDQLDWIKRKLGATLEIMI